ncbi:MAG TPA: allophanate hydrolase [Terracidiphilus sp.]|nr:allophanate hydrolase [Terracidiphilus sp.]
MDIASLERGYQSGTLAPTAVVEEIYAEIEREGTQPVWISLVDQEVNLARARALEEDSAARSLLLYGIPFAIKDNLDVAGMQTTAGCPAFAYEASTTATVVQRLLDAGAILIGKTNMDQFATGLVGTRSPYGVCSSVFDRRYISGGSSSGSAVSVAHGLVSFSLGTDTAGSGRVPAAFNRLVGLKPTRGWLSTYGLVPACRTLDCVSIFAETCADAAKVFAIARGFDAADPYSRAPSPGAGAAPWSAADSFRFGVPKRESIEFFGDYDAAEAFDEAARKLTELGGVAVEFDYAPFRDAANLLYRGPWVAERVIAVKDLLSSNAESLDTSVRKILISAEKLSATDAFEGEYALKTLAQECAKLWNLADFMLLPTVPTHYTIAEVQAAPLELNTNLGYYTNFVNLLDLAAVAVPAGMKKNGLPFSVSLIGTAFTDDGLLMIADRLHRALATALGGSSRELALTPRIAETDLPPGCIPIAVAGAHLEGQPLNWQLTQRKAQLLARTRTAPDYRFFALAGTVPPKPGLVHSPGFQGEGIEVEVWAMPEDTVGSFINMIPPPMVIGTVRLADGSAVKGFLCEPAGLEGALDITHLGGWRKFVEQGVAV